MVLGGLCLSAGLNLGSIPMAGLHAGKLRKWHLSNTSLENLLLPMRKDVMLLQAEAWNVLGWLNVMILCFHITVRNVLVCSLFQGGWAMWNKCTHLQSISQPQLSYRWEPGSDQQWKFLLCAWVLMTDYAATVDQIHSESILRSPQKWQKRLAIKCKKALIMGTKCSTVWTVSLKGTCLYQILLWGSDHLHLPYTWSSILMLIYCFMAYKNPFCKPGDYYHSTLTDYYLLSCLGTGKASHHSSAYLYLSSKFGKFRPTNNAYTPLPVFLIIWLPRLEAEWHHD